ncbi:MAG: acyl-CoA thioesterase [Thermoleophilaceae bacterium]|nr:acyl-CoA thioesterase [Thermoleophilaceae bacterium]
MRLIFIGDSYVAGTGDPECRGWTGRVAAASFRAGIELTAYNLGIGGDTSGGVLARWREEVGRRLNPDIDNALVAQFGTNDARTGVALPAAESLDNLSAFVDDTRAAGLAPLVVGPLPTAQPSESARIGELSQSFAAVCAEHDTPYVELHAALRSSIALAGELERGDGYHPGPEGYAETARAVLENGWWEWLARGR